MIEIKPTTIKSKVKIPKVGVVEVEEMNPLLLKKIELSAKQKKQEGG